MINFFVSWPKTHNFCPKWSKRVSSQSVNFSEQHVMMAKNGHFFARNGLMDFQNKSVIFSEQHVFVAGKMAKNGHFFAQNGLCDY